MTTANHHELDQKVRYLGRSALIESHVGAAASARAKEREIFVTRRDDFYIAKASLLQHRRQLGNHALARRMSAEKRDQMAERRMTVRSHVRRREPSVPSE
jgi:hypothetical protein